LAKNTLKLDEKKEILNFVIWHVLASFELVYLRNCKSWGKFINILLEALSTIYSPKKKNYIKIG